LGGSFYISAPDAAWIQLERWEALTKEEKESFPTIDLAFVIELRPCTDSLKPLPEKMHEDLNSGLRLGWLINLQQEEVEIYRRDRANLATQDNCTVEVVNLPTRLFGEDVLPDFVLDLF